MVNSIKTVPILVTVYLKEAVPTLVTVNLKEVVPLIGTVNKRRICTIHCWGKFSEKQDFLQLAQRGNVRGGDEGSNFKDFACSNG